MHTDIKKRVREMLNHECRKNFKKALSWVLKALDYINQTIVIFVAVTFILHSLVTNVFNYLMSPSCVN